MIDKDDLIEHAGYVNHYYGTPKNYVEEQLATGKNVILEIEMQGGFQVKAKYPDTIMVFVSAPSASELKNRLIGRGTETDDVISARLQRAYEESMRMQEYDYLVINDDLTNCIDCVNNMLLNEQYGKQELNVKHRMSSNIEFINNMKTELFEFSKGEQ
jgi:guanylate kinase